MERREIRGWPSHVAPSPRISRRKGAASSGLRSSHQRMARHQLIGMLPSGQRLDALHEGADRRMVLGDVEAEFVRWIIEIANHRKVGDGRTVAKQEGGGREALVDDAERVGKSPLEKCFDGLIAGRRKIAQKTVGPEIAIDLLVVEDDPTQGFEALVLAPRLEFSETIGEISEADARLGELPCPVH